MKPLPAAEFAVPTPLVVTRPAGPDGADFCDLCGRPVQITVEDFQAWRRIPTAVTVVCADCEAAALRPVAAELLERKGAGLS